MRDCKGLQSGLYWGLSYYQANSKSASGFRSVRAPESVSSFFQKYGISEGVAKGLSFGCGGYYEGNKLATTNGLLFYDFDDTYDAFVQYSLNRRWTLSLNVDNITNARYVASYAAVGLVAGFRPEMTGTLVDLAAMLEHIQVPPGQFPADMVVTAYRLAGRAALRAPRLYPLKTARNLNSRPSGISRRLGRVRRG